MESSDPILVSKFQEALVQSNWNCFYVNATKKPDASKELWTLKRTRICRMWSEQNKWFNIDGFVYYNFFFGMIYNDKHQDDLLDDVGIIVEGRFTGFGLHHVVIVDGTLTALK